MSGHLRAAAAAGAVAIAAVIAWQLLRDRDPTQSQAAGAPEQAEGAADAPAKVGRDGIPDGPGRAAPAPDPEAEALRAEATGLLSAVIDREAADPANAWALAHGILARGRDFRASDGRLAIHVLADDFLKQERLPGGIEVSVFPRTSGDVRVEPHTDLVLRTLLEVGVGLDDPLGSDAGSPTLGTLLRGSQARFEPGTGEGAALFADPNDSPWSVGAWCKAAEPSGIASFVTASGRTVDVDGAAAVLLGVAERETWFLRQAMSAGHETEKRKQGIFGYTCGGAHLFSGVETCAAAGFPARGNPAARVLALIDIYLFRVRMETELVERSIAQHPDLAPLLQNQDVKFLGHLLEALGAAERDGIWTPDPDQVEILRGVERRLSERVVQLGRSGVYAADAMAALEASDESFQFFLDLVGDACHAFRGLALQAELRRRRQG